LPQCGQFSGSEEAVSIALGSRDHTQLVVLFGTYS
jgi:hypothetical protein